MHALKLPLETTEYDEYMLDKRFRLLCRGHNIIVKHTKKLLRVLKRSCKWKRLLTEYASLKEAEAEAEKAVTDFTKSHSGKKRGRRKKKDSGEDKGPTLHELKANLKNIRAHIDEVTDAMNAIRENIGLTESGLQTYGKVFQKQHANHISSQMMQVEASRVWKGVEKVLFGNGKDVHYKKADALHTLGCKSTGNGIRYYDGWHLYTPDTFEPAYDAGVEYLGLEIKVKGWKKITEDPYTAESLGHKVKYACISREMFQSGWRYYVILTLDGEAPKKIADSELRPGTMGILQLIKILINIPYSIS